MAKILVMEDNPSNLELALEILHLEGHDTAVALSGRDGMRIVEKEAPDLILMDLQLPGIDGLSLTKMLKSNPQTRHIPILAVTAHANREIRDKALKAGGSGFLEKPIQLKTFRDAVEALLGSIGAKGGPPSRRSAAGSGA